MAVFTNYDTSGPVAALSPAAVFKSPDFDILGPVAASSPAAVFESPDFDVSGLVAVFAVFATPSSLAAVFAVFATFAAASSPAAAFANCDISGPAVKLSRYRALVVLPTLLYNILFIS